MSASSFTDHCISCDYPECGVFTWMSHLDLRDLTTAAELRKVLKDRGWRVNVRPSDNPRLLIRQSRLDYCPEHAAALDS